MNDCDHIFGLKWDAGGDCQPITQTTNIKTTNQNAEWFVVCPRCGERFETKFCVSCGEQKVAVVDGICPVCRNDLEQTQKPLPPPEMYEYPCPFCRENLSVYPMQKDGRINLYYLKCENAKCFDSLAQPSAAFIGIVCKTPPDGLRHLRYSKMNLPK